MLQEEAKGEREDPAILELSKGYTAGRHLLSLIKAILDLSKIEAGKRELHPRDPSLKFRSGG